MTSTPLTRVESHVIDVSSNLERVALGSVALYTPEFHQVEYVPVKGFCCNLWGAKCQTQRVRLHYIAVMSYFVKESSCHCVSQ